MATVGGVRRPRESENDGDEISEAESDRFIVNMANYLRAKVDENGWSEENVRAAFDEAVKQMPKGRARRALRANFDEYADKLCDTIYRDKGPSIELTKAERKLAKLTKDPESAFYALEQKPLEDFSSASFEELCVEFDYSMKRTAFDIPAHVWMREMELVDLKQEAIDACEKKRETALRRIIDIAQKTKDSFEKCQKKTQEMYEKIHNLTGRLAGATGARRKMQGSGIETARMAAEVVMLRHDLRKLALNDASLKIPEHEVGVTASYDGAILLGNYRGDFAGIVASRLPEDENDVAASFAEVDLPIFECALGLGGFDAEFEKEARKCGILFGLLDVDASLNEVSKNVGPSLLRRPPRAPFDKNKDVNEYDMEAYARMPADSSFESIAETSFDQVEYLDTDYLHEGLSLAGKDDDENSGPGKVKMYFSVIRVARAYIKLLNANGKRKRSSAVARYMSAAPAPEVLLMHVPDSCGVDNTDARGMSVELVVASVKALQTIVNEWNEMRTLFKSAAQSEGGFFIDINRSIGDMATEDFEKSGRDDRDDADKLDEETEKDLMDMLEKLEGPDASSDEDEDDSDDADD